MSLILSLILTWLLAFPDLAQAILSPCGATTTNQTSTFTPTSGTTYSNYHFSSTSGACITFTGQSNVTIVGSEIGPCGGTAGSTQNTDSNGIEFSGTNSNIKIIDNYIHTETTCTASGHNDTHDGIVEDGSTVNTGVLIQGNVVLPGEQGIALLSSSASGDNVIGNTVINPVATCSNGQSNAIKDWSPNSFVIGNYLISCVNSGGGAGTGLNCSSIPGLPQGTAPRYSESVEDQLSIGLTSGVVNALVENNYVIGGHSTSGSTFIACAGSGTNGANVIQFINNKGIDNAGSGLTVSAGSGAIINNQMFDNNNSSNVNAGGANYDGETGQGCETATTAFFWAGQNNKAAAWQGSTNWGGRFCGSSPNFCTNGQVVDNGGTYASSAVTAWGLSTTSTVTQIEAALGQPPLIPPEPNQCIVNSPYTTQTNQVVQQ